MGIVKKTVDFVMDVLETISFVGSLFIMVYLFIMGPNQVRGASMKPNFSNGDYILTSRITYKFRAIQRGDVIVFKSPKNPDIEYIKRVIGLPGDTISVKNGQVYVNNTLFDEKYISIETNPIEGGYIREGESIIVPEKELFVMGDNRKESSDSREFGPIRMSSIVGVVFYRYYPPQDMGFIKNPLPKNIKSERNSDYSSLSRIYQRFHNPA